MITKNIMHIILFKHYFGFYTACVEDKIVLVDFSFAYTFTRRVLMFFAKIDSTGIKINGMKSTFFISINYVA